MTITKHQEKKIQLPTQWHFMHARNDNKYTRKVYIKAGKNPLKVPLHWPYLRISFNHDNFKWMPLWVHQFILPQAAQLRGLEISIFKWKPFFACLLKDFHINLSHSLKSDSSAGIAQHIFQPLLMIMSVSRINVTEKKNSDREDKANTHHKLHYSCKRLLSLCESQDLGKTTNILN